MNRKLLLSIIFSLCFFVFSQAQEIEYNGEMYKVHSKSISLHGYDITESLTLDDRREIFKLAKDNEEAYKANKKNRKTEEKAHAKAERKQLKAEEKAQRKADGDKKFLLF